MLAMEAFKSEIKFRKMYNNVSHKQRRFLTSRQSELKSRMYLQSIKDWILTIWLCNIMRYYAMYNIHCIFEVLDNVKLINF